MLFYEPKLLKLVRNNDAAIIDDRFSALLRAEIVEIRMTCNPNIRPSRVSVLFYEPKLLKEPCVCCGSSCHLVSVLFYEPKLLKVTIHHGLQPYYSSFSALLRAEIVEIFALAASLFATTARFSALLRAEIVEIRNR